MNTLIIDTSDNKKNIVGLRINGKEFIYEKEMDSNRKQIILQMIDEALKKHLLKPKNLSDIEINVGPGSFTGLRIGLAIANALSFVLKIPINDKKAGEIILPVYPAPNAPFVRTRVNSLLAKRKFKTPRP